MSGFKVIDRRRVTAAGAVERLRGVVYFDASAWNDLADHPNREGLTTGLRRRNARVIASVISAGEILRTTSADRRAHLAVVIRDLNPDLPLFEDPLAIAAATAKAALRGEPDALLDQSGSGRTLLGYLARPDATDRGSIGAWLRNKENNLEGFRLNVEAPEPDNRRHHSPEILETDAFLRLLLRLPPAVGLRLSLARCASSATAWTSGERWPGPSDISSRRSRAGLLSGKEAIGGRELPICGRRSISAWPRSS